MFLEVKPITVKKPSRGDSPEAGEAIAPTEPMAVWTAVMFVFIESRQSCGELDATPVLIVLDERCSNQQDELPRPKDT